MRSGIALVTHRVSAVGPKLTLLKSHYFGAHQIPSYIFQIPSEISGMAHQTDCWISKLEGYTFAVLGVCCYLALDYQPLGGQ